MSDRWLRCVSGIVALLMLAALTVWAGTSEMFFTSDEAGENRITQIQEGDSVWVVVHDPDQNTDRGVRDRIWANVVIMDPHTGACVNWDTGGYYGSDATVAGEHSDFLEETDTDTGLFVSCRSLRIGDRESYSDSSGNTHTGGSDFIHGDYVYLDGERLQLGLDGRFENMDTIVGLYQDPDDETDVALTMAKILDARATISWDQDVYADGARSATITVTDVDENLSPTEVEYVPVFILVNPGSWNPVAEGSPANFNALLRGGGVDRRGVPVGEPIRWHNIYSSSNPDSVYYVQYPTEGNVVEFDTSARDGITRVAHYAQETGADTGIFRLALNNVAGDLGFVSLQARDVLAAYYLDPNDFDDFALATAYIEEHEHPEIALTDHDRAGQEVYWIGRDPVYVEVTDADANENYYPEQVVVEICNPHGGGDSEWVILDESGANSSSANSPVFSTFAGMQLLPVWDTLGVGLADSRGGFQLQLDNWRIEAFNEDSIYARYNGAVYAMSSLAELGDLDTGTAFPPVIERVRAGNAVAFDVVKIPDTQVFDGTTTQMYFLDRRGNRVSGDVNSDCVFVEVIDPDQDEDQYRREKIAGFWGGGQNLPVGPRALNEFNCGTATELEHPINRLLGDTNIFNDGDSPNVYVLNPRNGRWAAFDLLETGVATGDFISVICIDLAIYANDCIPTLSAVSGDTIIAVYQDPSNHSDSAWISVKYQPGGN